MKTIYIFLAIITFSALSINSSAQAPNTWTQKANFGGGGRFYAVGFSIEGKGYIGTGADQSFNLYNDFWEYDTTANTWTQKANFGGAPRSSAVGFSIGSKGFIGTGGSYYGICYNDFWEYNPATNTWTQKANFGGTSRDGAIGFSIGSKGYIGTGETEAPVIYYNDFWEYDTTANTWTQKANFGGAARGYAVGFNIGNKGYIGTGKLGTPLTYYNDFWKYDPATNTWTQKANVGGFARGYAVGFSIGANGYIGTGEGPGGFYNDFWEYDTTANTWTQKANFGGAGREGAIGFNIGAKGYIGTGANGPGIYNDFWKYTPGGCTLPSAPSNTTPIGNQTICSGNSTSLSASGTGTLGWYNAASGGSWLGGGTTFTTPVLISNTTYYVQDSNSCGANPTRTSIAVTVNPLPFITNSPLSQTTCSGSNTTLVILTSNVSGTTFSWTASATPGITGFQANGTNTIPIQTIINSGTTQGTVTYAIIPTAAGCSGAVTDYLIFVNPVPVPTITGATNLCVNSGNHTYTTEAGMQNYQWTVSPGGIINYGSGTDQLTVSWIISGNQSVSVTYTSPVGCNPTSPTVLNVTVNPYPDPAGPITGSSSVCPEENNVVYSVAPINNASTYVWALPTGASIGSGAGTDSITVDFSLGAVSGIIYVWGNNSCGDGINSPPFYVTVDPLPGPAGTITGASDVCVGTSGVAYSVTAIPNATGYDWIVPPGVVITSGNNTNTIITDFTPSAISGIITVEGTNQCGTGSVSPPFFVTVNPIPATPVVTNIGDTLQSNFPTGNQWYFEGNIISGATSQDYIASQDGYYWDVVTINGCSSDTSNHKLIIVTGIDPHSSASINIYPVPNDGKFNVTILTTRNDKIKISVYNSLGIKIYEESDVKVNSSIQKSIDLRPVSDGVYFLIIENSNNKFVKKIVIDKVL